MTNSLSSLNTNPIQRFSALNAFKSNQKPQKTQEENNSQPSVLDTEETSSQITENNSIFKKYDIEEIKKYAQFEGEDTLTNEEIKYGIQYGRSVIVNYSV